MSVGQDMRARAEQVSAKAASCKASPDHAADGQPPSAALCSAPKQLTAHILSFSTIDRRSKSEALAFAWFGWLLP